MEKLNDYFAMPVISIEEGLNLGYVLNIVFSKDLKELVGFVVADEESERENFLALKKIVSTSKFCIMVKDKFDLDLNFSAESNNPIGKNVYDKKGLSLGKVIDVFVGNNKVDKLITAHCEIPVKDIYCVGKDCIITGKGKKKASPSFFEIESVRNENLPPVKTMKIEQVPKTAKPTAAMPAKVASSPNNMLLGKVATMDIFGFNNELLVRKGDVVTQIKIDKAKKHGKINLLIFNCK